jgi:outer membrane protein assembly factor BamB
MPRPRLWPAVVVVTAAAAVLAATWLGDSPHGQGRVMRTGGVLIVSVAALLLWLLLFSRLPGRARLRGAGIFVLLLAAGASLFRVRGVTGDLLPILELRFARRPHLEPAVPIPAAPAPVAAAPTTLAPAAPIVPAQPDPASPVLAIATEAAPVTPVMTVTGEYPRFLGPAGDGSIPSPPLARDWSARPPRLLWRQPIGAAWSAFAVLDGRALTQEQRGDVEQVTAYDVTTGRPLWSHGDHARYETTIAGLGPRATPTIANGRVFTVGATGILNALDLATGKKLWSRHFVTENNGSTPEWGKSCSPLVADGRVIVTVGGAGRSLVAYDTATGGPAWTAGDAPVSYSSPRLAELAGRTQILVLNRSTVAGHDPATGAVLWEQPFPNPQPNVATPAVLADDRVLVSAGYGMGSRMFRIAATPGGSVSPTLLWESPRLKSKFANIIVRGAHVYGLDDGVLTCIDPATGERVWKAGRYGHGQMILAGGLLLIQTEEGEIVLVDPSPEGLRELTRFPALSGKTWNAPALAGRILLVRNDVEAAAYELPVE